MYLKGQTGKQHVCAWTIHWRGNTTACAKLTLQGSSVCCVREKGDEVGSRRVPEKLQEQWERGTQDREGTNRGEGEKD